MDTQRRHDRYKNNVCRALQRENRDQKQQYEEDKKRNNDRDKHKDNNMKCKTRKSKKLYIRPGTRPQTSTGATRSKVSSETRDQTPKQLASNEDTYA
jgi:hypothetical protein